MNLAQMLANASEGGHDLTGLIVTIAVVVIGASGLALYMLLVQPDPTEHRRRLNEKLRRERKRRMDESNKRDGR